jgi:uncharacterized membrane protein YfcA
MALELVLMYLTLGTIVGVMAGLLGIGGGAIMVPALVMLFQLQGLSLNDVMHLALGTSMASIIVTSFSSMRTHNANGYVNWAIVKSISVGVIVGAFLFSFIASRLSASALAIFFSVFMFYVAVKMLFNVNPKGVNILPGSKVLALAGFAIGGVSTLVSIGGGSLTVPFLLNRNIDIKTAIGSSAAIGLPISLAGTLGYILSGMGEIAVSQFTFGYVYWPAVLLISISSFMTAPIGARLAHRLPVKILKKCFAILLVAISVKMILSISH